MTGAIATRHIWLSSSCILSLRSFSFSRMRRSFSRVFCEISSEAFCSSACCSSVSFSNSSCCISRSTGSCALGSSPSASPPFCGATGGAIISGRLTKPCGVRLMAKFFDSAHLRSSSIIELTSSWNALTRCALLSSNSLLSKAFESAVFSSSTASAASFVSSRPLPAGRFIASGTLGSSKL